MKTTLDLPDELMKKVRLRAELGNRRLNDEMADLIRKGLGSSSEGLEEEPIVTKDARTGLPLLMMRRGTKNGTLTAEAVAGILMEQEAGWVREVSGQ